jgi:hypothetical protein
MLIAPSDPRTAIFLDGPQKFWGFTFEENSTYEGLIISGIQIEVDTSIPIVANRDAPSGSIVRHDTMLSVVAAIQKGWLQNLKIPLVTGLPPCEAGISAGFRRWQVVVGEGDSKRVLWSSPVA